VFTIHALATVRYVNVDNPSPASPYINWATAATNIQNALDTANPGDQIVVTNGVYTTSGRTAPDGSPTSIVVTNAVTLESVNGLVATVINGGGTMRCVYLTSGVTLIGFTLTNGIAGNGGGAWCNNSTNVMLSNCLLVNNAAGAGGGAYSGTLSNCTFSGNTCLGTGGNGGGACGSTLNNCILNGNVTGKTYPNTTGSTWGGGVNSCTLNNCTLSGNISYGAGAAGGGAYGSTLNNCSVSGSHADSYGGGAYGCNATNCSFSNNSATSGGGGVSGGTFVNCSFSGNNTSGTGGGAYYNTSLYNCTLSGNYAADGGGANSCILVNCYLTGNSAGVYGGGAEYSTLINCTVTYNTAQLNFGGYGGGVYGGTLDNSIVYYNNGGSSGPDDYGCTLNYCCTPTATGIGNITDAPLFGAGYQLQSGSPCIDAANNAYVTTTSDLAGNLRIANGTVDMGAYEFQTANPLTVSIQASLTNVPIFYPVNFTCFCSKGQSDSWNFGDGTVISNQLSVSHAWTNVGNFPVVLTVYDVSAPGGVSATLTIHVKNPLIYYVNAASKNPVAPYQTWGTAAANIQDAVDTALPVPQSLVLVTNGVYRTGGRIVYGSLTNRVVVNKAITVQSVNGPGVTVIQGNPVIGDAAVRCVYLTNNSVLSGFTIAYGATRSAGDTTLENSGGGIWCESSSAVISNCVLTGNSTVAGGGGIYEGTLVNSTVCSNSAASTAGSGNGGGASSSVLNGCVLYDNVAGAAGGGASDSTLEGCSLTSNQAGVSGGGADSSTLNNCTLTGNSSDNGGGANSCTLNNCIVYYNSSSNGPNYSGGALNYCCTQPSPGSGDGNTTAGPELTDSAHISTSSPCREAGSTNYVSGVDIDGQPWLNPPSIGCDEFYSGTVTGALSVSAQLAYTNVAAGFMVNCAGTILGHAAVCVWNFGDGTTATNQLSVSRAWTSSGVYSVLLTAYNSSYPNGVSVTNTVEVLNHPIHYVFLSSVNPIAPYLSWAAAATNIQDAVDAAYVGGTILVTNGIYQTGGRVIYGLLTNRVAVTKPLTVESVNGPAVTMILGYQVPGTTNDDGAVRCVYMTNNTLLSGFTLSNGATRAAGDGTLEQSGGGVFCESGSAILSDCVLIANSAANSAGGAYQSTLNNCYLSGNWAVNGNGGGALQATLNNCILSNNWVLHYGGGGAGYCTLSNCTLVGNAAPYGGGTYYCAVNSSLFCSNQAADGGGDFGSQLDGCILQSNLAEGWGGGGMYSSMTNCLVLTNSAGSLGGAGENCAMINCTVVGNFSGGTGGGVSYSGPIYNCILYYNTAASDGSNSIGSGLYNCCTTPDPGGSGNITNAPQFVNPAGGDYHLQSNSPCVNSGNNAYVTTTTDLDGNPRFVGGTVDIGAYEFQTPVSKISYSWLQQYGLPITTNIDAANLDGTAFSVYQDWIAGLNPTNPASVLVMLPPVPANNPAGLVISWQSVNNIIYLLQSSTNLGAQPSFSTIQSNIVGQAGTTTYTDSTATNDGPYFYRVGVQ
jgi:hypothetical protein